MIHRLRVMPSSAGFQEGALCYIMPVKRGVKGAPKRTPRFIHKINASVISTNNGERFNALTLEQIFEGEPDPIGYHCLPLPPATRAWFIKTDVRYIRKFESGRNFTVLKKNPFKSEARKVGTVEGDLILTTNGEIYSVEKGRQTGTFK